MPDVSIRRLDGTREVLGGARVDAFRSGLRGPLLLQGDPGYDAARTVWNGMIDRRPAMIARCAGVADVVRCVELARDYGLAISVRGGGHNVAGSAIAEDGLVVDLSGLREVRVDPRARVAYASPGATLGDFDDETQAFALTTPTGINSTTGLAGLTLGGGFGWLTRRFGMTIDNLRAVDVVTATGELVRASATEEPDLFWAVRGGGGNFGVVTSFELDLHPFGPLVLAGLIAFRIDQLEQVLHRYDAFAPTMPDELVGFIVMRKAPPLPFLPAELHGREMLFFAVLYAGDPSDGEEHIRAVRALGDPVAEHVGPMPFTQWQKVLDPLLTPGARNYWKSHNLERIEDGLVEVLRDRITSLPSAQTEIVIGQVGGAASRVPLDATAYPHRNARFIMNAHGRWTDPGDDQRAIAWARRLYDATTPFATEGVYSNFISDGEQLVHAAYGASYPRLVAVKDRWDPHNLFRANLNIAPSGQAPRRAA